MWEWLTTGEEGGAVTCYYITSLSPSQPLSNIACPITTVYISASAQSIHMVPNKCPVHSHGSTQVPSPFTSIHTSAQSSTSRLRLHCRIPLKCHMDPKTCVPSHDPKTCVPSHDLRPVSLHMTCVPSHDLRPVSLHMT